jgi:hypothetical protein
MTTTRTRKQDDGNDISAQAEHLVSTVAEVSTQAGERLTAVASSAGDVVKDAERGLRRSSDQTLGIVGGVSLGFASGLLVAGAHRLLVILSVLPLALVALAAMERIDRSFEGGSDRTRGAGARTNG